MCSNIHSSAQSSAPSLSLSLFHASEAGGGAAAAAAVVVLLVQDMIEQKRNAAG